MTNIVINKSYLPLLFNDYEMSYSGSIICVRLTGMRLSYEIT